MLRVLMVAGALALAVPAAAQVDSGAGGATPRRSYAFDSQEGWLGMGLSCSRCSYNGSGRRQGRGGRWTFSAPPSVFSVDVDGPADQAGLRAGDTLLAIDGTPLTSSEGGVAFGSVRPGQHVTLRYLRGGQTHEARLTAGTRPADAEASALAQQLRSMSRARTLEMEAQERNWEQVRRQMEEAQRQAQRQMEMQRQYLDQARHEMERAREAGGFADSARLEALSRTLTRLDSASAAWSLAESASALTPPPAPVAVAPLAPEAPLAPPAPLAPLAADAPLAPAAPVAPIPPRAWHREAGPLRYSGRLGDVTIEARGSGAVTTTEVSDSEVVVTSRDVSVRIALRPREAAPRPAPAPRPSAAPTPTPPPPD